MASGTHVRFDSPKPSFPSEQGDRHVDDASTASDGSNARTVDFETTSITLARYRGPSGDGRLDALRLRYAMTAVGMSEYEQRIVLGDEFGGSRADLVQCSKNVTMYSRYEYERCVECLDRLDRADLSYWAQPWAFATVLYGIAVADHRKNGSDSAVKRAWDMLNLILIFYFFVSSTFVNVLHFTWDDTDELPNGSRLVESYYGVTAFWVIDLFLTTQLSTTDEEGHVLMQPSQIMRQKALVIAIDVVSILPLDFIFQAARVWYAFIIFRYAKYIKLFRTIFLFEVVNRSIVTKGRLRFYYELKPIFIGLFWLVVVIHIGSICHSFTDDPDENGQRRFPLFIESFITMAAGLLGSTANIVTFNNNDRLLMVSFMLATLIMEGVVTAKASALLLSRDVEDENLRHLRATLSMVGHYKVPKAIQREVLSYQMHDLNDHASHHMQDLAVLPERMLGDVKTYSKISAVRQVPLFADESRECQELLAKMLQRREFPPEKAMVSFGEIGDDMFMITHGYAEVIIFNGLIVATLSRGDFFGEVALFSEDGKRMATVRALTYVDAWRLARKQFLIVCARYEDFFAKIMAEVEKRGVNADAFKKAVNEALETQGLSGQQVDVAISDAIAEAKKHDEEEREEAAENAEAEAGDGGGDGRPSEMLARSRFGRTLGLGTGRPGNPAAGSSQRKSTTHLDAPPQSLGKSGRKPSSARSLRRMTMDSRMQLAADMKAREKAAQSAKVAQTVAQQDVEIPIATRFRLDAKMRRLEQAIETTSNDATALLRSIDRINAANEKAAASSLLVPTHDAS